MARLRIGSRGSQLALWQARHVAALLGSRGHEVAIEVIHTTGDKILDVPLSKIGTKGLFTKEIEDALLAGSIDLAVHSLKDLPTGLPAGFQIAAVLEREDPRDAFLSVACASIAELPDHARVGTSSLRRQAQLKALRPDIETIPLRGNVDTRLGKLQSGEYHAIILAMAGINRLHRRDMLRAVLEPEVMCPAAGQGALAIEIRAGDSATLQQVSPLDHADAHRSTDCERSLLAALGGGCQVPIGAFAQLTDNGSLRLVAMVAAPDGSRILRHSDEGHDPHELGDRVAQHLLSQGAADVLREVYGSELIVPQQP